MIKNYLISQGASKVGICKVNSKEFSDLNYGISIVLKLPKECIRLLENEEFDKYWKLFHKQVDIITDIAFKGEKYIQNQGYDAFALTLKRNEYDMEKLLSILPYKTFGTKSGLGWIGRSALFVTEEYGSAVVLSSILTDMPLETDSPITDSYCDDCEECQKACPVDAINPQKWNSRLKRSDIIDIKKCSEYIIKQVKKGSGCSKCLANCKLTQKYYKKEI